MSNARSIVHLGAVVTMLPVIGYPVGRSPRRHPIRPATGVNNRGQVVGQSSGGPDSPRAFLWEDGVLTDLNDLVHPDYEGTLLYAGYINNAGFITGRALDPETGDQVTFVATPRGTRR